MPIFRAVREGQRMGNACPRLVEMPIREVLAMQLDDARALLRITKPHYYHEAHAKWRAAGIDPYDLLAPVAEAA